MPRFMLVHFDHRTIHESPHDPTHYAGTIIDLSGEHPVILRGAAIQGDFRDPTWEPIHDSERLLDCTVQTWPAGDYTAAAIAGKDGRLRDELAEHGSNVCQALLESLGEIN